MSVNRLLPYHFPCFSGRRAAANVVHTVVVVAVVVVVVVVVIVVVAVVATICKFLRAAAAVS